MDTTKRILKLTAQGLSDGEIAETLNREGFTNDKGGAFNANAVRSRRVRADKKSEKTTRSDTPETSDKEPIISGKSAISDIMREEIRQIVREEIQAAMEGQPSPKDQTQLAPVLDSTRKVESPKTGRKVGPVLRPKIAGTIDAELARRFEEWRKERGGISLSHGMDTVMWHFFGKPPMSFEITDKSDETDQ